MVHTIEGLGGIYIEEIETLVPHILTELVPFHFAETYDDLVE